MLPAVVALRSSTGVSSSLTPELHAANKVSTKPPASKKPAAKAAPKAKKPPAKKAAKAGKIRAALPKPPEKPSLPPPEPKGPDKGGPDDEAPKPRRSSVPKLPLKK